ncbi:MAG: hypothetical protein WA555_08400 [Candidatus Sulfotelmatobacter sp.]
MRRLISDDQQTILVFNHANVPADASIAAHLPWSVRQARELETDQPLTFQENGGQTIFHKRLAGG